MIVPASELKFSHSLAGDNDRRTKLIVGAEQFIRIGHRASPC
jgi:hypothetical protein